MALTLGSVVERFQEKFGVSAKKSAAASSHIPGGYSRSSLTFGPHAIYVERGDRQYIDTVDGHRLLDFHNNFSCSVLGHNHPRIREAILDLVPRGFSFGNPMEHEHQLAKMLCERIASVERVIFSCSSSEACLSAARIARANTGKNKIAKFEGGYHGLGDLFVFSIHPVPTLLAGPATRPKPVPNTAGLSAASHDDVVMLPQNDLEACRRILADTAGDVAAVILELQCGAGGVIQLEQTFVQGLREITRELDILMIVDETITLRAAYHGMQSLYDVKPDLTVMGKIIGGGLPLGAVGGRTDLFRMNEAGDVFHSGTHHGHPLSTKAGIACLEVMNEGTYDRLNSLGNVIQTELNQWARKNRYPFSVNGVGSHLGYEISDQPGRVYKSCRDILAYSNEEHMQIFAFEMANRGIFPMYRGQIALSEPMTISDAQEFIRLSKEIIEALYG
jgi:glutamate-1-semialdehyde 2,1-aminomutase